MPNDEKTLDQIEDEASGTAAGSDIALDRKEDDRIKHIDQEDERVVHFGDKKFEKLMMVVGIGIVVTMFVLIFIFYNTVEVREAEAESLASQVEDNFFGQYITDKDYVVTYRLGSDYYEYDPLLDEVSEGGSSKGVGSVSSKSSGGYRGSGSNITDGSGKVILELGDPAVTIETVLVTPDGNSVIFDTKPANTEAENKYGLRVGAYEIHLEDDKFETLVSDSAPERSDPTYGEHYVEILSISPNGRYVAYTNRSSLRLYDRLSGASVEIVELSNYALQPDTGWAERPVSADSDET